LQAAFVYVFAILVFIIHYTIGIICLRRNFGRYYYLEDVNLYWSLVVTYIFPMIFFGYVWITIWCNGYMPSATGKMKQLVRHPLCFYHIYFHIRKYSHRDAMDYVIYYQVWYFFRILIIFYLIWLPGMFLIVIGAAKSVYREKWMCIGYLFCGLQPIVSTCMAMTKSDVRKYTRDLITLSYARKVRD
jgi:hypothetical protein